MSTLRALFSRLNFNHKVFAPFMFGIGITLIVFAIMSGSTLLLDFANQLYDAGLLLVIGTAFTHFWISRRMNVESKIFESSIATAVYVGSIWLALGFVLAPHL